MSSTRQDALFLNRRRALISKHPTQIGLDFIQVKKNQATYQLLFYFIPAASTPLSKVVRPANLTPQNVKIQQAAGWGTINFNITSVRPATQADDITPDMDRIIIVELSYDEQAARVAGDIPLYTLELVNVANLDPFFNRANFSLQVDEPELLDPKATLPAQAELPPTPEIDYLAKDFDSFRQLMLNRLSLLLPEWREPHVADIGQVLIDVLAYAADYQSYHQDAVATEAYLSTARNRTSVRRHARLLDYRMHEGNNARTWVQIEVKQSVRLDAGTQLLTQTEGITTTVLDTYSYNQALRQGALVFETMHPIDLFAAHNEIHFYTWGATEFSLLEGATSATLEGNLKDLKPGDVLIFEEVLGLETGEPQDANPRHRHAVRLTAVSFENDLLGESSAGQGVQITNISWHTGDALPFPLIISTAGKPEPISLVRGNIVLADHGQTVSNETLPPVGLSGGYRPQLQHKNLTYSVPYDHKAAQYQAASVAASQDPKQARPQITKLTSSTSEAWRIERELLSLDRFTPACVVETENDRRAYLRFGDGVHGKTPEPTTQFKATYRIGNGLHGNVGREAIQYIFAEDGAGLIAGVRNLLSAQGGTELEPLEHVRLYAPQAFHTQERCVIEADYAAIAERHPEVQKAAATLRWTGSGYTAVLVVDRTGNKPIDEAFLESLLAFMKPFQIFGSDLVVRPPRFVPLDIALTVYVAPTHLDNPVKHVLLEAFSPTDFGGGKQGFFHPDRWTLNQPLYLSNLVAHAMRVAGVAWVEVTRFQRWGQSSQSELEQGQINIGPLEIVQLYNNPAAPQNGQIQFNMVEQRS